MEDPKQENQFVKSDAPRDIVLDLIEQAKAMDEFVDDHQGMIIGDRLSKIHSLDESDS